MIVALDDSPDVVAMVPTLGRDEDRLSRCLESVVGQVSDLRVSIICIANGGDPTAVLPPMTTLLTPGLNLGWSGGLCLARTVADAEFLWLVQDDMTLDSDCLATLHAALSADESLGSVAPVVVGADGGVRPGSAGGVLARDGKLRLIEWLPPTTVPPDQLVGLDRLDYVPSRGCLMRTTAWDSVGGLDPHYYPVTWSDVDLCTALRAAGWQFRLVVDARTRHEQSGSTPSAYGHFLFRRNSDRFARKWGDDLRVAASQPAPDPAVPASLLADIAVAASETLDELAVAFVEARAESAELRAGLGRAQSEIDQLHGSNSWQVTAPFRAVRRWAHGLAQPRSGRPDRDSNAPDTLNT